MKTLKKLKEYTAKISNFTAYTDEDGTEYIDTEALLKNFYIRRLMLEVNEHPNLIRTNVESKDIKILDKQSIITILKRELKLTSDLKESVTISEYIKTLMSTPNKPEPQVIEYYNSLKINDVIKVEVGRIIDAGAMTSVVGYPSIRGIIHISEIVSGFVTSVHEHFEVGQIVEAKIILKREEEYRLNLSVKEFKDREILDSEVAKEIAFNEQKAKNEVKLPPEFYEIEEYVKSITGELSNDAKLKLKALVEEHGIFKFSINISAASQDTVTDVGLLFLNKLEQILES